MLDMVINRAFIRKDQKRVSLDYAFIVTNGIDIVAVETIGYQIPLRKSRLIPRQEQLVYQLIKGKKRTKFTLPRNIPKKEYSILSLAPKYMIGLTRSERQLKQVLMIALDQLKTANHLEEMKYWLTEWNPKKYPYLHKMNEKEVWQALYRSEERRVGKERRHLWRASYPTEEQYSCHDRDRDLHDVD